MKNKTKQDLILSYRLSSFSPDVAGIFLVQIHFHDDDTTIFKTNQKLVLLSEKTQRDRQIFVAIRLEEKDLLSDTKDCLVFFPDLRICDGRCNNDNIVVSAIQ